MEKQIDKLQASIGQSKLQPYTERDIDELKGRYKVQYQKHSINKVDENGRIVMEAVNVQDFAVKLKISETRPAAVTFRDETRRYLENLEGMTGRDIELHELLNHDERIVLVNGIAAIGKSVLMKQLAFSWANNEMYTQFKLCIIMECREINSFVAKEGAHLKKHELFSEFLKMKFEYDLGGGVSTLILMDGLDELWDIGTGDSMIWELLDVKNTKYAMARIILTGRPHVEGKLDRNGKYTGGIKRFEIQGLTDEQRRNYIKRIASCEKDIANINRTIDSSEQCSQVAAIPGFLNMLSCVSMISGGETLKSVAELYVWLLYLLLKEHVQKKGPSHKLCFDIFNEYSSELEALCEICHQLLNENKIIFEGDVKSRLMKCGKGTEFLEGLFADISDCRTKKYQFKHLTIMEILSAIHISRRKDRMEIIEHNLKTEFYQVVIFSCQLIGGYKYDGIIKDMFGNDEELKAINVEQFLPRVLDLVGQRKQQQPYYVFQLSIEIIMCFINKDVSNKNFIISTVKTLRYKMDRLYKESMGKVSELCGHLSSAFNCNEEDLKETFRNVLATWVDVDDVKSLTCVKYLPNVEEIFLDGMKINSSFHIRSEVNAVVKCKNVSIEWCEFADDGIMENNMAIKDHQLNRLVIYECKLNKYSFINVCNWALEASVNTFHLWLMDNIEHSWWGELVDAIHNAKEKNNGILALRKLDILDCTQKMSKEMQMKIVQCGIDLKIDGNTLKPPSKSMEDDDLSSDTDSELEDDGIADVKESAEPEVIDKGSPAEHDNPTDGNPETEVIDHTSPADQGEPTDGQSDDMIKLDLSTEKSNFVKVKKVLLNVVPKYLRQLFKEQWNSEYPDQQWDSSHASRGLLLKNLSRRMNSATDFEKKVTTGNEQKWDAATLIFILLDSNLNLSTNVDMVEDIKVLKGIDSAFSADRSKVSMSSEEFIGTMDKIKSIARRIFNENAEREVKDIENSPEERKMKIKLRQLLAREKSRERNTDQSDKILEKGYQAQTKFRPEEANFRTIEDLLLSVILNHLRQFFKCRWNEKYPNQEWKSNSVSGEFLFSQLSYQCKTTMANMEIEKLKIGNEAKWGIATIANILLDSHLQLATDFEPKIGIETLINIEKSFYEDKENMECSFDDFKYFAGEIILASKKVFDNIANDKINEVLKVHEEKLKAVQLEKKVEDPVKYFELTVKEVNFVKITKIVLDVLPKYLRKCFIEHWNRKYSAKQWNSDEASGQFLINKIPKKTKKTTTKDVLERLSEGNEEKWDTTTLVYVMLFSDLDLVPKRRGKEERVPPLLISEEIDIIRDNRNKAFAHAETMVCSSDEFRKTIAELKSAAKNIFGEGAYNEIDSIAKSQARMQMSDAKKDQLKEAISINKKLEQSLKEFKGLLSSLEKRVHVAEKAANPSTQLIATKVMGDNNTVNINIAESHKATERSIDEVSGDLKSAYQTSCQTHQIHAIDERKEISIREFKISDFAVTLKISQPLPPVDTYKAETRQFLENLIGTTSNDVDLSDLLDETNRVTFVRGIAGIGKSVLAKQLAYKWANGDLYSDFKLLIMFECRKINEFKGKEGSALKEHDLIDKFIETKLCPSYGNHAKILLVIDGIDELYDIYKKDSIIWGLLDPSNKKYRESKFIITGRPRVEHNLSDYGKNVGGIRRVEIQGLNDKQVKEYVKKIARPNTNDYARICQEIESSNSCLHILHVPQFLNTFCCVVIYTEGQKVCCTAELYTWTVYLLLKQHANIQGSCTELAQQIFGKYAQELKVLAKICYQLLMANTLTYEEDITTLIGSSNTGKMFFHSLFVQVSHHTAKYQFKHLSLLEFLAALHVCCIDEHECKKHIKDILEQDYIETMIHACEIIANSVCDGMIKTMLYAINERKINVPELMTYILNAVCDYTQSLEEKFQRSLEVLACFLNEGATEKKSILTSIGNLSCGPLYKSVVKDSKNLFKIIKYLKKVHKCSKEEMKEAFKKVQIGEFIVNEVDTVECAEYLGSVDLITVNGMVAGKNTARSTAESVRGRKCSFLWIEDCEFNQNEDDIDHLITSISALDELVIWNSKLNKSSFIKLVMLGASSGALVLDQLEVHTEWWQEMVEAIEKMKKTSSGFLLSELIITGCKPIISYKMLKRVQHCDVQLTIDGNKFPHNSTESAATSISRPGPSTASPQVTAARPQSSARKRSSIPIGTTEDKAHSSPKKRKDV